MILEPTIAILVITYIMKLGTGMERKGRREKSRLMPEGFVFGLLSTIIHLSLWFNSGQNQKNALSRTKIRGQQNM